MEHHELQRLLQKLTKGTLSAQEKQQLEHWYQQHGASGIQQSMDEDWVQTSGTSGIPKRMEWNQFKKRLKNRSHTPVRSIRRWAAVAASVLLLILATVIYYQLQPTQPRRVVLRNDSFKKKEIQLEDGTTVWLNRKSQITFQKPFEANSRIVTLMGEAYFDVQRDTLRPFIVTAEGTETKVLGTSFNISAFPQNQTVNIALVEGKVQINYTDQDSVLLRPGEQFTYRKDEQTGSKQAFLGDEPYAWKNGILYFDQADVHEVTQTLEQWYDVTFTIEADTLLQTALVHRVDTKKRTLQQVLEHISRVADYTFEAKNQREIIVRPKAKK